MSVKKEILHYDQNNYPVCNFKIPNQTGDYVEVSNLGCTISGIHIHKLDGIMENIGISSENNSSNPNEVIWGRLCGGELGKCLSEKVWSIVEENDNSVFLASECLASENTYNVDFRLGVKITWVNMNRLIIDYFITPREKTSMDFAANLDITNLNRSFLIRSFCPTVLRKSGEQNKVQDTEYKEMSFVPLNSNDCFISPVEDIKPLIELSDRNSKLRISVYSTFSEFQSEFMDDGNALSLKCSAEKITELDDSETFVNRVIFGFDYIDESADSDDTEPSPFSFFL